MTNRTEKQRKFLVRMYEERAELLEDISSIPVNIRSAYQEQKENAGNTNISNGYYGRYELASIR